MAVTLLKEERKVILEISSRGETRRFPATASVVTEKVTGQYLDSGITLDAGTSAEDIAWIQAADREAKMNATMIEVVG